MDFNIPKFNRTVAEAKAKAPQLAAQIDKAAEALLSNPFIADMDGGLLVLSSNDKADNVYFARANQCNCKAADYHKVCWHRIANRLVRAYQWNTRKDC